jgi:sodium/bile acid cotransporter 7
MSFFKKNWFLLALLLALIVGYAEANRLELLTTYPTANWIIVAVTMFLMAWPIQFGHLQVAVLRPVAPGLACLLNVGLIPLLVWPFLPFFASDLAGGMVVAAATPCTLASASVWTRRAGGNDAISMLVTLLTNGTCFLVMPFWIYWQTGEQLDPELLRGTIYKLFFFVVLPITAGQILRVHPTPASWATDQKSLLSGLALVGILIMVLIGSVSMGLRVSQVGQAIAPLELLGVAVFLTVLHSGVFWSGIAVGRWLGLPRPEWIPIGFAGSQKTLMIGLTVAITLGFSIVPIIVFHSVQLIVDTAFADRIRAAGPQPAA